MAAVDLVAEFPQPAGAARWAGLLGSGSAARLGAQGRRVVLVTPAAPRSLWTRPVRFLDNFSSGRRGASSAEAFLAAGYGFCSCTARSAFPFAHRYPPQTWLSVLRPSSQAPSGLLSLEAEEKALPGFAAALRSYQEAEAAGTFLAIEFLHFGRLFATAAGCSPGSQPLGACL